MTDTSPSGSNSPSGETVGQLLSSIVRALSNRNIHKLAGTALAAFGLAASNVLDLKVGALYALAMHVTGGLKKLPD